MARKQSTSGGNQRRPETREKTGGGAREGERCEQERFRARGRDSELREIVRESGDVERFRRDERFGRDERLTRERGV